MKSLSDIIIVLGLIIVAVGLYYFGYEGIIEPNEKGHHFGRGDMLQLIAGAVGVYLGLIGVLLGLLTYKVIESFETAVNQEDN